MDLCENRHLLFAAASQSLLQLASDPKRLGGNLGVTAVVHTWGRNLVFHPHLHCIVTAGGLREDQTWVDSSESYLLPVKVLGALFRGKFLDGLVRLFNQGRLAVTPRTPPRVAELLAPSGFARLKDQLYRKDWVVFTKAPFKKPDALFRYLGLYTHRVAISNHRILPVDDQHVVFRTRDKKTCQLAPVEFIRRFLLHVLPRGFVKVRHFGHYAPGNVNSKLATARTDIERHTAERDSAKPEPVGPEQTAVSDWRTLFRQLTGIDLAACPHCGSRLVAQPLSRSTCCPRAPPSSPALMPKPRSNLSFLLAVSPSLTAMDIFASAANATRFTRLSAARRPQRFAVSSAWRPVPTATRVLRTIPTPARRLLFVHARIAALTSRTRGFVQHVV